MLDQFIQDRVNLVSYSRLELDNIAATLSNLKSIINNEPDFGAPFLGGSYKRGTMVKGISDVDVYFKYTGSGNPQAALDKLKRCLVAAYPNSVIKQDKPSILVDFQKIPINITPYKHDNLGFMVIPDKYLLYWKQINIAELEKLTTALKQKSLKFIDLIKILKLWNFYYKRDQKNFEIETRVSVLFLNAHISSYSLSDLFWTYLQNSGFPNDARKLSTLMIKNHNSATLRNEWIKFIENK